MSDRPASQGLPPRPVPRGPRACPQTRPPPSPPVCVGGVAIRRVPDLLSVAAVARRGLAAAGRAASARVAAPAGAGHPLVGAWLLTFPDEPEASPRLNSYPADGITLQTHPAGNDAQGAWAPTGERTAVMTLLLLGLERGATRGTGRVRAALEVDVAGDAFAGSFTLEFVAAGGASRGEEGPLRVEEDGSGRATRGASDTTDAAP